jgi:hypothetical protein
MSVVVGFLAIAQQNRELRAELVSVKEELRAAKEMLAMWRLEFESDLPAVCRCPLSDTDSGAEISPVPEWD